MNKNKAILCFFVILAVVGAYYFGSASNRSEQSPTVANETPGASVQTPIVSPKTTPAVSLDTQEQCGNSAKIFFNSWKTDPTASNNWAQAIVNSGGSLFYSNHYNTQMGKCLIRIEGTMNKVSPDMGYYSLTYLYDVYENSLLGSANIDSDPNAPFIICMFKPNEKECSTSGSFLNAVASIMKE